MENILNQSLVLSLNKAWQPIGIKTVEQAIKDLMSGKKPNDPPHMALDIEYAQSVDGLYDFDNVVYMNPVKWSEWINLPVRPFDYVVRTSKQAIRVPTVIISARYDKVHKKRIPLSNRGIFERDGGICQYTGVKLDRSTASVDHVIPLSRGGTNTWENMALAHKKVNNDKGNRLNEEIGLKLRRIPQAPTPKQVSEFIQEIRHRDWSMFIKQPSAND